MTKWGSDKGRGWHNYTTVYSAVLGGRSRETLSIFELGLGTDNEKLESNMGSSGRPGASLRGWRELFPNSRIFGADIDKDVLFREDRIDTFYCDQLDKGAINELWSQPQLKGGCDLLIEDGLHTFEANLSFLQNSLGHLRVGGFYVIEDILTADVNRWPEEIASTLGKDFPNYDFVVAALPNPRNNYDNNLLLARRRS